MLFFLFLKNYPIQNLENGIFADVDGEIQKLLIEANRLKAEALLTGENAAEFDEQLAKQREALDNAKAVLLDRKALLQRLSYIDEDLSPIGIVKKTLTINTSIQ